MEPVKTELSSEEKEWRKKVYDLFHDRRPNIARYFDFNRAIPFYEHGYSPGCTVLELMHMTKCTVWLEDIDYLIDK